MFSLLYQYYKFVQFYKMIIKIIVLLVFFNLSGCFLIPHVLYKIDVQQGNVVTDEMLDKLKVGMTKPQVRFVLGSPLVVDTFRDNRWDYVYIQREKGDLVEQKRLTIYFEDERLIRIENEQLYSLHPVESDARESRGAVEESDDQSDDR
ncbi:outer membrane protein assembly factor BamE [Nitrosomonas marina]|uniref:Outer membrane protein assembly factor BamE n=2 Tax=Nitrosomonas marina TaxID=917 RepID=A0A1H8DYB2_9PROT|nr:outer membrane protein assembly factor BamE [Nitrosomonas marina]